MPPPPRRNTTKSTLITAYQCEAKSLGKPNLCRWQRKRRKSLSIPLVLAHALLAFSCWSGTAAGPKTTSFAFSPAPLFFGSSSSLSSHRRRSESTKQYGGRGFWKDDPFNDGKRGGRQRRRRLLHSNSTVADENVLLVDHQQYRAEMEEMQQRILQLEQLAASHTVEIKRLKDQVADLTKMTNAFAQVIETLRQAGLQMEEQEEQQAKAASGSDTEDSHKASLVAESFEDTDIFGQAPSSVIEAADVAGASILAGMLGGKQRMLVDVRDAELNTNSDTLVQFIELAILPVAAGLEGLRAKRNRLKVVFPTVGQLLEYRRTMALAAPEVVALSTLGFDPVEPQDNLVVIVAPAPDDIEGLEAMNELLEPKDPKKKRIEQPIVVLNHHMVPISGPAASFEVAYHLRLLTVQFMSGDSMADEVQQQLEEAAHQALAAAADVTNATAKNETLHDQAVEAAMKHAQEVGLNHGVTRAMVIRAYPNPWHVFVDMSPDTDADFEVAAIFAYEPSTEEVNRAIVDCLEGSEEEDEIVAQQMQQALERGQLDRVTELLGDMGMEIFDEEDEETEEGHDSNEDNDDDHDDDVNWDLFDADSV